MARSYNKSSGNSVRSDIPQKPDISNEIKGMFSSPGISDEVKMMFSSPKEKAKLNKFVKAEAELTKAMMSTNRIEGVLGGRNLSSKDYNDQMDENDNARADAIVKGYRTLSYDQEQWVFDAESLREHFDVQIESKNIPQDTNYSGWLRNELEGLADDAKGEAKALRDRILSRNK